MSTAMNTLNEAVKLHQAGNLDAAEQLYGDVLMSDPDQPDALHLLGVIDHQRGRNAKAIQRIERALQRKPNTKEFLINLGAIYRSLGQFEKATQCLAQSLQQDENSVESLTNLGNVLTEQEDFAGAVRAYQKALAVRPDHLPARLNYGIALRVFGCLPEAIGQLGAAMKLDSRVAKIHAELAIALAHFGDTKTARASYLNAIRLQPDDEQARVHLGVLEAQEGRVEVGGELIRDVLADNPRSAAALIALSQISGTTFTESDMRIACELTDQSEVSARDRSALHRAIGRYLDGQGKFSDAFSHFDSAAALRPSRFNIEQHQILVNRIMEVTTPELLQKLKSLGNMSRVPIFVVGMPRSGTSLVEQILSSHPGVIGVGEIGQMARVAREMGNVVGCTEVFPEAIAELNRGAIETLSQAYLDRLLMDAGGAQHVVDKLPDNFLRIGLISVLFPAARIIHCRRHPLDTIFSCYSQDFAYVDHATHLDSLAHWYVAYHRLMEFFRTHSEISLLEVDYAELTDHPGAKIRSLVADLDLTWDDACLNFANTQRTVRTPSAWQVRQPIYQHSVGRWRNYREPLQPVIEILREAGVIRADEIE